MISLSQDQSTVERLYITDVFLADTRDSYCSVLNIITPVKWAEF